MPCICVNKDIINSHCHDSDSGHGRGCDSDSDSGLGPSRCRDSDGGSIVPKKKSEAFFIW